MSPKGSLLHAAADFAPLRSEKADVRGMMGASGPRSFAFRPDALPTSPSSSGTTSPLSSTPRKGRLADLARSTRLGAWLDLSGGADMSESLA